MREICSAVPSPIRTFLPRGRSRSWSTCTTIRRRRHRRRLRRLRRRRLLRRPRGGRGALLHRLQRSPLRQRQPAATVKLQSAFASDPLIAYNLRLNHLAHALRPFQQDKPNQQRFKEPRPLNESRSIRKILTKLRISSCIVLDNVTRNTRASWRTDDNDDDENDDDEHNHQEVARLPPLTVFFLIRWEPAGAPFDDRWLSINSDDGGAQGNTVWPVHNDIRAAHTQNRHISDIEAGGGDWVVDWPDDDDIVFIPPLPHGEALVVVDGDTLVDSLPLEPAMLLWPVIKTSVWLNEAGTITFIHYHLIIIHWHQFPASTTSTSHLLGRPQFRDRPWQPLNDPEPWIATGISFVRVL